VYIATLFSRYSVGVVNMTYMSITRKMLSVCIRFISVCVHINLVAHFAHYSVRENFCHNFVK